MAGEPPHFEADEPDSPDGSAERSGTAREEPVGSEPPEQVGPAQPAPTARPPRATVAGRVWIAIAVAVILLVLLIIFIAENSQSVTVSFLGASGTLSLALAMLIAAVAGAVITLMVGTARILQLRREVREQSRGD
jgi:lipopolysaccharide assembly protein A